MQPIHRVLLPRALSLSLSLSLSFYFNSHFPGGLASVYWSKRWWSGGDNWSYKSCKAPVKSSPPTNQHSAFYMPDALPVTQPTVSKHWRENITFHGLACPKLTWGSSNFVSDHNSSWLPWGRVAMPLISPLMPVPQVLLQSCMHLMKSYANIQSVLLHHVA